VCGIAGYVGPKLISGQRAKNCLTKMKRRGPDFQGISRYSNSLGQQVLLLHSRLAILDLDPRSNQPFQAGPIDLVFNGEIYNYKELAGQIETSLLPIVTRGDTEVLARTLASEGEEGLKKCEGMWGLAWYDRKTEELFLSRDRFGEKPLFVYREDDGGVFFASQLIFLQALLDHALRPNIQRVRRFLANGYKSLYKTPETFFEDVFELKPGHMGRVDRYGHWSEYPWWRPVFGGPEPMGFEEAVTGARERLLTSLELRLRADVPIAFLLSGGIDSNALIAIAKRHLGIDVRGFTILNSDRRYDEAEMVNLSVKSLGLDHTGVNLDFENFFSLLSQQVAYHGAPTYTINSYAGWRLSEHIAQQGFKVSISGVGADEMFSGYYDHHNAYISYIAEFHPKNLSKVLENWRSGIGKYVRNPFLRDPLYLVEAPESRAHIYFDSAELNSWLVDPLDEPFTEEAFTSPLLRNRMANELLREAVPVVLHEDDLNSMYHSIENRSPYLDSKLFDFCNSIPTEHLVQRGRAKAVLREAVRGLVPDEILDSPKKVGFNAPIDSLVDRKQAEVREYLMNDSPIFDIVRRDVVERLLASDSLENSRNKFLFSFVSSKMFLEEFS